MATPSPAMFANKAKPEPKPRPVKRKPRLSSHVDGETLAKLRKYGNGRKNG